MQQSMRKSYVPRRSMKERDVNCESRVVFRKQFYKTELCRFHQSGCVKGDSCCFAHGVEDLQTPPDLTKTSLCQAWIERRCPLSAEACQFAHGWGDMHVTQAFVEYGSRQSKRAGQAKSSATGGAASAAASEAGDRPQFPSRAERGLRRSMRRLAGSARPHETAREYVNESPSGSSPGSSQSTAAPQTASPASSSSAPAVEPHLEVVQAAGPAYQVAIVLQPWSAPNEMPLVPLQLSAVGMAQPAPAQRIPDNRAMEMLLRQAMPDHYDD